MVNLGIIAFSSKKGRFNGYSLTNTIADIIG
jgi:hypothetical protein